MEASTVMRKEKIHQSWEADSQGLFHLPLILLYCFFKRVFHKLFSQDLGHVYAHLPVGKNSSSTTAAAAAPVFKRTISWTRNSPVVHTGLRSGKVNLEKIRRSQSESDGAYDENVTLESVTDLENKKEQENSMALSQLQCQEVNKKCTVIYQTLIRGKKTNYRMQGYCGPTPLLE